MSISPAVAARESRQRVLWDRTAEVAGRLNRAQAELVAIAEELIADGHWGDGGFKSPQHYLVVRAGFSPEHAADVVRVARRRGELVKAAAALDAGELSLDQVSVVARHVPTTHQESLTDFARNATVPQLRRAVARHAFPAPSPDHATDAPDSADAVAEAPEAAAGSVEQGHRVLQPDPRSASEQRACAKPDLSMHYDADGRFQLRYSAPATIGALVEQALKEAKDALFTRGRKAAAGTAAVPAPVPVAGASGQGVDHQGGRATYADALEEIAHRSLASVTSSSRSSRYRVYLHLSTDGAWVSGGHAIPLRLLGRFICDGVLQPVWETQGRPVSVGRRMRILPARTRRLIEDRDRGCRFPGCTTTGFVEIHHLDAWADGGRTDENRQISLCTIHHDGLDRGDYTIDGDPTVLDGLVVTNRFGLPIRPPRPAETAAPPSGDPPAPSGTYQPPTGQPVHWRDLELPPDADLPRTGTTPAPVLTLLRPDKPNDPDDPAEPVELDDPDDGLVYDSYRQRR